MQTTQWQGLRELGGILALTGTQCLWGKAGKWATPGIWLICSHKGGTRGGRRRYAKGRPAWKGLNSITWQRRPITEHPGLVGNAGVLMIIAAI